MNVYRTPGVYVEEIQTIPPGIAAVATAIPAFIGMTGDKTLELKPTRITSLLEYEEKFGMPQMTTIDVNVTKRTTGSGGLLGVDVTLNALASGASPPLTSIVNNLPNQVMNYAIRHFYANGGGPCWIYSLGDYKLNDSVTHYTDGIDALKKVDEPTLLVFPGATRLGNYADVVAHALTSCLDTQDRFVIADVPDAATTTGGSDPLIAINGGFRTDVAPTDPKALQYGSAYWPYLRTSIPWYTDDDHIRIVVYDEQVLQDNGTFDSPATPSDLASAVGSAEVAISDAKVREDEPAVYSAVKAFAATRTITLPPSAAVAGAYATTDRNRGVWKAPANVALAMVTAPAVRVTNDHNDRLNVDTTGGKSINAIRSFAGRGTLIWGARTLAGNDNEYRYTSVRRLTIMIEESIEKAIGTFVFESNDANTWTKVRTMIENFLFVQWRAGALQGAKPEHAFNVRVGLGVTMTPDDILNGRMIVKVAIAPVRPAEFIILTFEQMLPSS